MTAQEQIIAKYGIPSAKYQAKFCVLWLIKKDFAWFPCEKIFINKDFKDKLFQAFKEIEQAGLQHEIKTFDGCYQLRSVRNSLSMSLHSWAMAIDVNCATEKLGQVVSHFSKEFIEIMVKYVYWGGNYKGRKDPMHFSLYNG